MDPIILNLNELVVNQLAWLILRGFSIRIPWNNMNSFLWDDRETWIGKTFYLDGEMFALGLKIMNINHVVSSKGDTASLDIFFRLTSFNFENDVKKI
jgi:hypothetical protein